MPPAIVFTPVDQPPLDALRALVAESQADIPEGLPSTAAGIYGYLGYEMVRLMERLPDRPIAGLDLPDALLMRPTHARRLRHGEGRALPHRPGLCTFRRHCRQAWESAQNKIDDAVARLSHTLPYVTAPVDMDKIAVTSNTSVSQYDRMVQDAKEYIRAGDIFQVVLSQRFEAEFTLPPTALYRALRRTNPSPYMYLLDFGGFAVVGVEPRNPGQGRKRARSPSAPSPAPASAARRPPATRNWPTSCSAIPRSWPSI